MSQENKESLGDRSLMSDSIFWSFACNTVNNLMKHFVHLIVLGITQACM